MILEGVASVLPLLFLISLGFFSARQPWFGSQGMGFLSKFTLDIAIPLYMFHSVTRSYSHPRELLDLLGNVQYPMFIILSGAAAGSVMCSLLAIRPPQRGVFINAVSLSNVVVMGIPVTVSLFGESVLPAAMVYYACNSVSYWTLGVWLLRRDVGLDRGGGVFAPVKAVLLSRPIIGLMAGVAWVCTGLPLPRFAVQTLGMISGAVTPLAMVFIGSVIRHADFRKISHFRELVLVVGYRLLMVPVVSALLCSLFPISPVMKKVFFILSVMPAMAQLPIMAREVGSDYELASMSTAVTTACSMGAVPVYVFLLDYWGIFGASA